MIRLDPDGFGLAEPTSYIDGPAGPIAVYERAGNGIPLVLIHGINMRAAVWADVVELLDDRHIITLDLRGHGQSTDAGPFSVADYAADVLAVVKSLTNSQVQLAGVSIGGLVACFLAQERPEIVQSVTAFGSALKATHRDLEAGMSRLREIGVDAYFSHSLTQGTLADSHNPLRLVWLATLDRAPVDVVEAITRAGFGEDLTETIRSSGRPVQVVTGELDQTCSPEAGSELASAAGGTSRMVPGAGHVLPIEDPAECAAIITSALGVSTT
ncbi:MAG: alpha/beta hydrolase [Terrimesophilobacter sp.]